MKQFPEKSPNNPFCSRKKNDREIGPSQLDLIGAMNYGAGRPPAAGASSAGTWWRRLHFRHFSRASSRGLLLSFSLPSASRRGRRFSMNHLKRPIIPPTFSSHYDHYHIIIIIFFFLQIFIFDFFPSFQSYLHVSYRWIPSYCHPICHGRPVDGAGVGLGARSWPRPPDSITGRWRWCRAGGPVMTPAL